MKKRQFIKETSHKITDEDIKELQAGLVSILVVHEIQLSLDAMSEELKRLGKLQSQDIIGGALIKVSSGEKSTGGIPWHSDRSYHPHPPQFVVLYTLSTPDQTKEGATFFCDLQKAYQDMSGEMLDKTKDLQLLHLNKYQRNPKQKKSLGRRFRCVSAVHPVIKSDETGRYLYFNWDYTEDFPLRNELGRHIYQKPYIYTHHWSPFDLVIFNNFKTNHKKQRAIDRQSFRRTARFHVNSPGFSYKEDIY